MGELKYEQSEVITLQLMILNTDAKSVADPIFASDGTGLKVIAPKS